MKKKLKKILGKVIFKLPSNSVRIYLLKNIFGYQIGANCKIGKSIILADEVLLGNNVTILNANVIVCGKLKMGSNSSILEHNRITGEGDFYLGEYSRVIFNHSLDLSASIVIGNNTWLAGRGSQIWTHGSTKTKTGLKDLSVKIGNDNYISSVLIGPGVILGNKNLVGLGTVLTESFNNDKQFILGNPAILIKKNIDWKTNW
tara:strand:- start:2257 stop:2862 length:606 start_codon:yes stop_codon:yes gene_type:complete